MEISDKSCKEKSWVENCNIKFAEHPDLTAADFVKVFSKEQAVKGSTMIQGVLDKVEVDISEISSLLEYKQVLHDVQSAITAIKSTRIQSADNDNSVICIERFLTKLYLLLSLRLQTNYISKVVYIDLFSTFLDSCGIVSWPAETIRHTAVIFGKERTSFPDLCLLCQDMTDTSMNTLGTVTYSDEELDTQRYSLSSEGASHHTSTRSNKEHTAGIFNVKGQQSGYPSTSGKSSKTVNFQNEMRQKEKASVSNWSPLLEDMIGQSTNQPISKASAIITSPRKRCAEGRIRQPAVKLPPGAINKIPIIITLAADEDESATAHDHNPFPYGTGLGHTKSVFEPPGRKLNLPSKLFSGIRSAIEQEFPSTRLLLEQHNSRRPIIPIVVTTEEAAEEILSEEESTSHTEDKDASEGISGISERKRRRMDSSCSNNSKYESHICSDCDSQCSGSKSRDRLQSLTTMPDTSCDSILDDIEKFNTFDGNTCQNNDSNFDIQQNEGTRDSTGKNRNTSSNTKPIRVYFIRNPNILKQCGNKVKIAKKCLKVNQKKEIKQKVCSRVHGAKTCKQVTFKGEFEDIPHSSKRCPRSVIAEDNHCGQPAYVPPSVFSISPENSMYSFKFNSEFETKHVESQKQGSSIIEYAIQEIHDTSKWTSIKLSSIDWLLDQPLMVKDTVNFLSDPFEIVETSGPCPEMNNIPRLTPNAANKKKFTSTKDQSGSCKDNFCLTWENHLSTNRNINAFSANQDKDTKNNNADALSKTDRSKSRDFIRNLLIEWSHSLVKPISVGFMLHNTKVVVAALDISQAHFDCLSDNETVSSEHQAFIRYTKELDLLKKSDRIALAYIALHLSGAVK